MTTTGKRDAIWLDKADNVLVVLRPINPGEAIKVAGIETIANHAIPTGHKIAIKAIPKNGMIVKYGEEIGQALENIAPGDHVHIQNVRDITLEVLEKKRKELGL